MSDLIFNTALYGDVGAIPYPVTDGATEALEFYTDVIPAYTNEAEERSQLRALPRQYFKYTHNASFGYMQEIHNALRANLRGRWLIPQWFEAQRVQGVSVGQEEIPVDTLVHDLRADTYVLVWKSLCEWQFVLCTAVTSTSIFLATHAMSGTLLVIPCRVGRISDKGKGAPTGYANEFDLQYYVDDVLAGLDESPEQYNGQDLYTTPYLIDGQGTTDIDWEDRQVEYTLGGIDSSTPWPWSVYNRQYSFDDAGAEAYYDLKRWFYRRAGKHRPFYSPTFESDLQKLSTGTVTSTFQFKNEGYVDRIYPHLKRIGFQLRDESWLIRTALSASNVSDKVGQVTLNSALNVAARDIMLVSLVPLNRLNTDRIEITLGQNGHFTTTASVMEIPE